MKKNCHTHLTPHPVFAFHTKESSEQQEYDYHRHELQTATHAEHPL